MPHALLLLLKLQARAVARRAVRGAGSLRGALLLAFGAGLMALFILPAAFSGMAMPRTDPEAVRTMVPLGMLVIALTSLVMGGSEQAIAFAPAEVEFLFPGPFTRRQILLYRIVRTLAGIFMTALIFSLVFLRHAVSWPACFIGAITALAFIQLLSMAIVLVGQTVGQRAYTLGRKIAAGAVLAVIAAAVAPAAMRGMEAGWLEVARQARLSVAGRVLLTPMEPFGHVLTAATWPAMLGWAGLALLANAFLLGVVMWLDANYLEASAARSQAIYDRVQRAQRSGIAANASAKMARYRVPMPPFLAGAGPIAWRQLTTALRNSRAVLLVLVLLAVAGLPMILARREQELAAGAVVGVAIWCTFILAPMLRFDFRGELDNMDWLKSLPLGSLALAIGELLTPVLMMTTLQSLVFIGSGTIAGRFDVVLLAGVALALPVNTILFALENALFLLYPMRFATGAGDLQGFGRQMLLLLAKVLALLIIAAVCGGVGAGAYFLSGRSLPAAIIAGGIALIAHASATIPLVAWCFRRFDPSRDVPPQ